ncbi:MAG: hypothetical protein IPK82_02755 [Polyangiaceae bacterium]|nr:hypothetical protein [Polyangiaceae bacterium]
MAIVVQRLVLSTPAFALLSVTALLGCGAPPYPIERYTAASPVEQRYTDGALTVAEGDLNERFELRVDARSPRTSVGRFKRGQQLRISVIDGKWTYRAGSEMVGADGLAENCRATPPHACAAGEGVAPGMGLMLFQTPDQQPAQCQPTHRFYIPTGVEFALPTDAFVFLAPNDWDDGMANNSGAIKVEVEVAENKTAPALSKLKIDVSAQNARTPLGRIRAGTYLRVSVLGGTWTNDPNTAKVGSEGQTANKCFGSGSHVCSGGENQAPMMGLTLLMASCPDGGVPPPVVETRQFIGSQALLTVAANGLLELGPNDWEDGCHDNQGALRVEVTKLTSGR